MRLVCPNCDAEYEVDASAVPDMGRDVQCSNCGHGWFQLSPRLEEELAAEAALFDAPPTLVDQTPPAIQDPAEDDIEDDAGPSVALPARSLDESVLAVLRDEAQRETSARRAEAPPPIETQDELGLSAAIAATMASAAQTPENPSAQSAPEHHQAPPYTGQPDPSHGSDPVSERVARIKGVPQAPTKPQSRRDMLPEIDEINTTLRASSERRSGDAGAIADSLTAGRGGKSAFRSGFVLMMVLAVAIVALYVIAPKLAVQIPAAKGALDSYVASVDGARMWLDGLLKGAIGLMRGASD